MERTSNFVLKIIFLLQKKYLETKEGRYFWNEK
uniref:Uncharacterized protein n=1 Tax=Marseillevirus sp. TaxID=2809551 RepID=A0AA96ENY2_9VIRU|nr:hypothetical protein MarFTMF_017 [Marseillevirus sp.]